MSTGAVVEQLAATRTQLEAACDLLISATPEALDRCSTLLESAGRQMEYCQSRIAEVRGDPAAIEEARRGRRSFIRAGKLLAAAAGVYANWISIRGSLTGGYT